MKRTDNPPDRTVENGVVVPGMLTVNEMTLREHQSYLASLKYRLLDFDEAVKIHGASEAMSYFGYESLEPSHMEGEI